MTEKDLILYIIYFFCSLFTISMIGVFYFKIKEYRDEIFYEKYITIEDPNLLNQLNNDNIHDLNKTTYKVIKKYTVKDDRNNSKTNVYLLKDFDDVEAYLLMDDFLNSVVLTIGKPNINLKIMGVNFIRRSIESAFELEYEDHTQFFIIKYPTIQEKVNPFGVNIYTNKKGPDDKYYNAILLNKSYIKNLLKEI